MTLQVRALMYYKLMTAKGQKLAIFMFSLIVHKQVHKWLDIIAGDLIHYVFPRAGILLIIKTTITTTTNILFIPLSHVPQWHISISYQFPPLESITSNLSMCSNPSIPSTIIKYNKKQSTGMEMSCFQNTMIIINDFTIR